MFLAIAALGLMLTGCATATPSPAQPPPSPRPAPIAPVPRPPPPEPPPETADLRPRMLDAPPGPVMVEVHGSSAGAGAGPVTVATIKQRAMPKGNYDLHLAGGTYPAEAQRLRIGGTIRVKLVVDVDGKVRDAVLLSHLGHGLDEYALDLARKVVFHPAIDTADKPIASVVVWTFNMTPSD